MIDRKTCRLLGTLARTHGTDGSMFLKLRETGTGPIRKPEFVFLEIDGLLVPFAVASIEEHTPREMIIALKEADDAGKAVQYNGCAVWIREADMGKGDQKLAAVDLRGYTVVDRQKGPSGTVEEILDISRNPLLRVVHEGKEYLIPFHEDIIIQVDKRKQTVSVNLPEGLTEI